jgi:hypothetical protein
MAGQQAELRLALVELDELPARGDHVAGADGLTEGEIVPATHQPQPSISGTRTARSVPSEAARLLAVRTQPSTDVRKFGGATSPDGRRRARRRHRK